MIDGFWSKSCFVLQSQVTVGAHTALVGLVDAVPHNNADAGDINVDCGSGEFSLSIHSIN